MIIVLSFTFFVHLILSGVDEKTSNTKSTGRFNLPCVVTPFKGDIYSISQGNGTDSRTRNAPSDNRDYCTVFENILRAQIIAYRPTSFQRPVHSAKFRWSNGFVWKEETRPCVSGSPYGLVRENQGHVSSVGPHQRIRKQWLR